jgi:hypothetical protein
MLKEFLDKHKVDVDALARIKNRLLVVGRFNQRKGPETEVFLFTKRPDISAKYAACFTGVRDVSYESFVQALRPAVAERVVPGDIPRIEQVIPSGDEAEESSSIIDTYNFFFWRAIANTPQQAFQRPEPGLLKELLKEGEHDAGKGIFKIIRSNLNVFCSFQPRMPEIIEAVSNLLGNCGKENNMPAYAAGGALPGGFPEKLVDFLFAENTQSQFTLDGVELTGEPWGELTRQDAGKSREMLCRVVTAFRDGLLESKFDQFSMYRFRGKTLSQQARAVLDPKLMKEFGRARDAFNGLRQILRSKVLLSMVLEWVFRSYYDLDAVRAIPKEDEAGRDQKVRDIVLRESQEHGIAVPVKRANPEERKRFSKSLADNFEGLLVGIVADEKVAQGKLDALPAEIRALADEIRGDSDRRALLKGISGSDFGTDFQKAFVEASKTILLDVLCPTLYQSPVLSVQMLRKFFSQETMAAYLTAVFLDDKHQDVVRQIAEQHLDYFVQNIDDKTKTIKNAGKVQERLLRSYIDMLAKPEVVRRLKEELDVLREMHTLLENTPMQEDVEAGPGRISALRDSEGKRATLERTPVPDAKIKEPVAEIAHKEIEKEIVRIEEAAAAAKKQSAAAEAPPAAGGESAPESAIAAVAEAAAGAAGAAPPAPAKAVEAEAVEDDALSRTIRATTEKILAASSPAERKNPEDLAVKVTKELFQDEEFVRRAKKDVHVFEKVLHLIYRRYNDNPDKKTFRNKVERMTLVNLMLLFQKELGLGKVCSNLHHMLLDLVQHLDPENPDPKAFIQDVSLTKYFDNAVLEGNGITNLRETLLAQAHTNLENTVSFVSELRGVKYLFDAVKGNSRAEVVVVNASADEFLSWVVQDNLTPNQGKGRLQAGKLVVTDGHSEETIPPGLVYLTDVAFPDGLKGKLAWIQNLSAQPLQQEKAAMLLPPICLSTGVQDDQHAWAATGKDLAKAAEDVPAPVFVVGPSPYMNRKGDIFPTYLPAGYAFAAHVLSKPEQAIRNERLMARTEGRFRVIGSGTATMRESLEQVVWGEDASDTFAFAVDFYLYLVLTALATAMRRGGGETVQVGEFYPCFYYTPKELSSRGSWESSRAIEKALLGEWGWFAMQQNLAMIPKAADEEAPAVPELQSVAILRPKYERRITDVAWFNRARRAAGLP